MRLRTLPYFLAPAGALVAVCLPMAPVRAGQSVPPGTPVMLEFMQEVSSRTAKKGDPVKLRVYTNVVVGGKTLIKQDAPAQGTVMNVHRRRTFGRNGEVKIKLTHVTDAQGARVPLEAYKSGKRFSGEGPGAAGAGLLVFGPVGAVAGVFVKGKEITISRGTRIQAQVSGAPSSTPSPPVEPK
jgi:hypothetical protein